MQDNKDFSLILCDPETKFEIDFSGMHIQSRHIEELKDQIKNAVIEMNKIEAGEIKNPDENRKVTHFTDRKYYPQTKIFEEVENFARDIRDGKIRSTTGEKFEAAVINGIGGSALGPQLLQFATNGPYWNEKSSKQRKDFLKIYFLDNTDTAGIADLLEVIKLSQTLIVNISKSGGTQETKNNMIALIRAFEKENLDFSKNACAITMENSELDKFAKANNWLKTFPMAESIGGRTSETSIVGHLPAALAGINFKELLAGACHMDEWTRNPDHKKNPAYMLALCWYIAGKGKGEKNMVIVPYSDRLILLSRYLQQLVMESLGKERDRDGKLVCQGLNVFGNKGGTDAHAFIQQLNDGKDDFFATFIEVLKDPLRIPIDNSVEMGDYLHGFQVGLTNALLEKNRSVITIKINEVNPFYIGMLIALYERAVAFYAELININAFHQPGVQAYKLASREIIKLQNKLIENAEEIAGENLNAIEIARKLSIPDRTKEIEGILAKFAENSKEKKLGRFTVNRKFDINKNCWLFDIK
ncbi:MAG TPA: hypothetical protein P5239_08205 [Victivallales bacterium]|nr:hypothetical protein [Victivallales bacterium]